MRRGRSPSSGGAKSNPFVSPEVFRLVVRLEAQKTLGAVDVDALERKFRVPHGFADEGNEQRKHEAAGFDGIARARDVRSRRSMDHAERCVTSTAPIDHFCVKDWPESIPISASNSLDHSPQHSPSLSSARHTQSAVFLRVSRDSLLRPQTNPGLGSDAYELPSSSASSSSNCSAVFGASREKRVVMWSPARDPPSNAIPEAWNASLQYAKTKTKVLHAVEQKNRKMKKKQLVHLHERDTSSSDHDHAGHLKHPGTSEPSPPFDPFEWLRQQPHGEQRAALLAAKYGLADHHVKTSASPLSSSLLPHLPPSDHTLPQSEHAAAAVDHDLIEGRTSRSHVSQELRPELKRTLSPCPSTRERKTNDGSNAILQCNDARDERIVVSCRLPGGMVLTLTLFSRKKIRHLKALILQKQTRFTQETQFDLYLPNGRRLGQLEGSLYASGIGNRSLVQIVPTSPR
ncbi:hypothetical protein FI667_g3671, partial [Globisporangium splendens]